jgi:hypothetical protein
MYEGSEEAKEDQVINLLRSVLAGEPVSEHLQSMTLYACTARTQCSLRSASI